MAYAFAGVVATVIVVALIVRSRRMGRSDGFEPFGRSSGERRPSSSRVLRGSADMGWWTAATFVVRLRVSEGEIEISGPGTFGRWVALREDVGAIELVGSGRPTEIRFLPREHDAGQSRIRFWVWWQDEAKVRDALKTFGWTFSSLRKGDPPNG